MRLAQHAVTRLLSAAASVALLAAAATFGYFRAFGFYSANDDEGYIMQTVRSYLAGHQLFDDVFTQYGPAFYHFEYVVHGLLRFPLTHDFERFFTLAVWVSTAALSAGVVLRLTRSVAVALIAFGHIFVHLMPVTGEPGHPQAVLVLTIALVCFIFASDPSGRADDGLVGKAATAGVLTAFAALTKVNIGGFLFLGISIPLALAATVHRPMRRAGFAGALLIGSTVPFVVTRTYLADWAMNYALVVACSVASLIVTFERHRPAAVPVRIPVTYVLTFGVAAVAFLLPPIVRGTSLPAMLAGTVLEPARFAEVFSMRLVLPASGVAAAVAGLIAAILLTSARALALRGTELVILGAKILLAALTFYLSRVSYGSQFAFLTPLLWIVVLPPRGVPAGALGRGILGLVAAFQSLQAYPVAGSQVAFATFSMTTVGFVCAHDAIVMLVHAWRPGRMTSLACRAALLLFALWFYRPLVHPLVWRGAYDAGFELRLPGASRLHLSAAEVARYQWIAGTVGKHCRTLLTLPGLYSLHVWTKIDPPTNRNATAWTILLGQEDQAALWRAVDEGSTSQGACAVFNPALARNWLGGRPLETLDAYKNLMARFEKVAEVDGYQLLMPPGDPRSRHLVMPLMAGRQSFARNRTPLPVASSAFNEQPESTVRTWFRTARSGVILGCQSTERPQGRAAHQLPVLYVGRGGQLYGQYFTGANVVQASGYPVNDGNWHHVALVRQHDEQSLYVDGVRAGSLTRPIQPLDLAYCQAGIGMTTEWPDASNGWMTFTGEVDGLSVALRPWTADEIARDWVDTRPHQ